MMLEWLRRHDPKLDDHAAHLPVHRGLDRGLEEAAEHGGGGRRPPADGSLGIGSLQTGTEASS